MGQCAVLERFWPFDIWSKPMRMSSFLTAAAFVASLAASTGAMAANFSGTRPFLQQQLAQVPVDPPAQPQQLRHQQTSPYDSPDFIVPPYEIQS
jgi:hypothetical protein